MSLPPETIAELSHHYASGLSAREAARRVGCHASTACEQFKRWREADQPPKPRVDFGDLEAVIRRMVEERLELSSSRANLLDATPDHAGPLIEASRRLVRWPRVPRLAAWIGDTHIPYHDAAAVEAVVQVVEDAKPDLLVLGGDVFDCYSVSDYDQSPERAHRLQDEFDAAREFIRRVDSLGCDVVYLLGNHEARLQRLIARNQGLFKLRALEFERAADLPKRWTIYPPGTFLRIGKLTWLHGDVRGLHGGKHVAHNLLGRLKTSLICGHYHRMQTYSEPSYDHVVRAAYTIGHLSSVEASEDYYACPHWAQGAALVDYASDGSFSVQPYHVIGGRAIVRGRVYG